MKTDKLGDIRAWIEDIPCDSSYINGRCVRCVLNDLLKNYPQYAAWNVPDTFSTSFAEKLLEATRTNNHSHMRNELYRLFEHGEKIRVCVSKEQP